MPLSNDWLLSVSPEFTWGRGLSVMSLRHVVFNRGPHVSGVSPTYPTETIAAPLEEGKG